MNLPIQVRRICNQAYRFKLGVTNSPSTASQRHEVPHSGTSQLQALPFPSKAYPSTCATPQHSTMQPVARPRRPATTPALLLCALCAVAALSTATAQDDLSLKNARLKAPKECPAHCTACLRVRGSVAKLNLWPPTSSDPPLTLVQGRRHLLNSARTVCTLCEYPGHDTPGGEFPAKLST